MPDRRTRRVLLVALRLMVSCGLIIYLVWQADPANIWARWQQADFGLIGLALLIQLGCVALSAFKWDVLLRARGMQIPYRWLLAVYFIGQFANNFLPTSVGGDALRVVQLGRRISSYAQASASVFIERLTGFVALSLIANLALLITSTDLFGTRLVNDPTLSIGAAAFALAGVAAGAAALAAPWFLRITGVRLPARIRKPLQSIADALGAYAGDLPTLLKALGLSLLFHLSWISLHIVAGLAIGIAAPPIIYAVMVPLTDMLGLAPIFFNNLGARDFMFTLYLGQIGIPTASALALAFTAFTIRLVISSLGGLVLLFGGVEFAQATAEEPAPEEAVVPQGSGDTVTR